MKSMNSWNLKETIVSGKPTPVNGSRTGNFWELAPFQGGSSWIGKWKGESPWERHSSGDEFIHVQSGSVTIEIITASGKTSNLVREGSVFVVPRGHWHRQLAPIDSVVLGATPGITDHSETEPSWEE